MISISLCMIVRNEEEVLEECLKSVCDICDEIIIVDTGSLDKTKEIAKRFTDKIIDFKWINDFSAARNFAFSHANMDYILWLDGDDILLPEDQEKLKILKRSLESSIDSVSMNYVLQFDAYNNPSFYFRRNRLVKRSNNFKWMGSVHEYLEVGGEILPADIAIVHRKSDKKVSDQSKDRNLKIYEGRLKIGEKFTPRDLFYYANELRDHGRYDQSLVYYKKFLATNKGWVEDKISACLYMAASYALLGKQEEELRILLKTLEFDIPRPETCCRLGDYFKAASKFEAAIFWYCTAIQNNIENPHGFYNEAYSSWYPHLSLCVCYWALGNVKKSMEHNEIVGVLRPSDSRVLFNQKFFEGYLHKNKI